MKKKIIAIFVSLSIVTGFMPQQVYGTIIETINESNEKINYKNGIYGVKNKILKNDKDEESVARNYVSKESKIEIVDNSIVATITLNRNDIMSNTQIKVNGNIVEHIEKKITDTDMDIKFNLNSLEDKIEVSTKVNTGFPMNVSFRVVFDTNNIEEELNPDIEEKSGLYTIENDVLQINNDKESMSRKYLDKVTEVEFKEGKIYLTLKFTGKSMMANHKVNVNENDINFEVVNDSNDNLHIKFEITSLEDNIKVSTIVLGTMNVEFRVLLNEDTLIKVNEEVLPGEPEETPEEAPKPDITPEQTPKPEPTPPNSNPSISNDYSIYKVQNEIITDSQIGYQAARNALNEISYMEIIDGINYITLGFSQMDLISNIRITVDGKSIAYDVLREDNSNNTKDIRFKVSDLYSLLTIEGYVGTIGRDISFGVDFLEDTLVLISKTEAEKPLGKPSTSTTTSTSNSEIEKKQNKEEKVAEPINVKESFKKYTIENEVLSNNETGLAMSRKYLNKISILEEIDGKLYLILTLLGTDLMDNFRVSVNGEEIEHSIVESDEENNLKSYRFIINNINDNIRVYLFVKPVQMNIDFGVKLLEETKVLVEESKIETETSVNKNLTTNKVALDEESNREESKIEKVNVSSIIVITAVVTTLIILLVSGAIYLILKKRKGNNMENNLNVKKKSHAE